MKLETKIRQLINDEINNEIYTESRQYLLRFAIENLAAKTQSLLVDTAENLDPVYIAGWDVGRYATPPVNSLRIKSDYGSREVFCEICDWVDRYTAESTQNIWFQPITG
jgi:hypothetical protein